jgi:hypothetical protein
VKICKCEGGIAVTHNLKNDNLVCWENFEAQVFAEKKNFFSLEALQFINYGEFLALSKMCGIRRIKVAKNFFRRKVVAQVN